MASAAAAQRGVVGGREDPGVEDRDDDTCARHREADQAQYATPPVAAREGGAGAGAKTAERILAAKIALQLSSGRKRASASPTPSRPASASAPPSAAAAAVAPPPPADDASSALPQPHPPASLPGAARIVRSAAALQQQAHLAAARAGAVALLSGSPCGGAAGATVPSPAVDVVLRELAARLTNIEQLALPTPEQISDIGGARNATGCCGDESGGGGPPCRAPRLPNSPIAAICDELVGTCGPLALPGAAATGDDAPLPAGMHCANVRSRRRTTGSVGAVVGGRGAGSGEGGGGSLPLVAVMRQHGSALRQLAVGLDFLEEHVVQLQRNPRAEQLPTDLTERLAGQLEAQLREQLEQQLPAHVAESVVHQVEAQLARRIEKQVKELVARQLSEQLSQEQQQQRLQVQLPAGPDGDNAHTGGLAATVSANGELLQRVRAHLYKVEKRSAELARRVAEQQTQLEAQGASALTQRGRALTQPGPADGADAVGVALLEGTAQQLSALLVRVEEQQCVLTQQQARLDLQANQLAQQCALTQQLRDGAAAHQQHLQQLSQPLQPDVLSSNPLFGDDADANDDASTCSALGTSGMGYASGGGQCGVSAPDAVCGGAVLQHQQMEARVEELSARLNIVSPLQQRVGARVEELSARLDAMYELHRRPSHDDGAPFQAAPPCVGAAGGGCVRRDELCGVVEPLLQSSLVGHPGWQELEAEVAALRTAVAGCVRTNALEAALEGCATREEVQTALAGCASKEEVEAAFEERATREEVQAALAGCALKEEVEAALEERATREEVQAALAGCASKEEVQAALEERATKEEVQAALAPLLAALHGCASTDTVAHCLEEMRSELLRSCATRDDVAEVTSALHKVAAGRATHGDLAAAVAPLSELLGTCASRGDVAAAVSPLSQQLHVLSLACVTSGQLEDALAEVVTAPEVERMVNGSLAGGEATIRGMLREQAEQVEQQLAAVAEAHAGRADAAASVSVGVEALAARLAEIEAAVRRVQRDQQQQQQSQVWEKQQQQAASIDAPVPASSGAHTGVESCASAFTAPTPAPPPWGLRPPSTPLCSVSPAAAAAPPATPFSAARLLASSGSAPPSAGSARGAASGGGGGGGTTPRGGHPQPRHHQPLLLQQHCGAPATPLATCNGGGSGALCGSAAAATPSTPFEALAALERMDTGQRLKAACSSLIAEMDELRAQFHEMSSVVQSLSRGSAGRDASVSQLETKVGSYGKVLQAMHARIVAQQTLVDGTQAVVAELGTAHAGLVARVCLPCEAAASEGQPVAVARPLPPVPERATLPALAGPGGASPLPGQAAVEVHGMAKGSATLAAPSEAPRETSDGLPEVACDAESPCVKPVASSRLGGGVDGGSSLGGLHKQSLLNPKTF